MSLMSGFVQVHDITIWHNFMLSRFVTSPCQNSILVCVVRILKVNDVRILCSSVYVGIRSKSITSVFAVSP